MTRNAMLPILALIAFGYTVWYVERTHQVPEISVPVVDPTKSPFGTTIAGTGLVEPCSENIRIAAALPGVVEEVAVSVGQTVRAGDLLFRLDGRQQRAELAEREANLAAMVAQLDRLRHMPRPEDVPPSEARVQRAAANVKSAEDQLRRVEELRSRNVVTEREYVESRQAWLSAQAELHQAEAEHMRLMAGAWDVDIAVQQAAVEQARAQVEQARVELQKLDVRAPIDATVLKVDVRPGEYVGTPPGSALLVIGNVSSLHVRVDIDEHDLPRFRSGMPGVGYVRGNTTNPLPLRFVRVEPYAEPKRSLSGTGDERIDTRVLQVIYAIEPTATVPIYVGQQLDVFLDGSNAGTSTPSGHTAYFESSAARIAPATCSASTSEPAGVK